ncbi:MAG: DUF6062 family protein [Anaerolineae bacterium]|nr:DUF6062 family protein [Anaerolineae bacterium]
MLGRIDNPDIAESLKRAGGLCWPHFRTAIEQRPSEPRLRALAAVQRDATERLLVDLEEFIRKHDYRFQDEAMATEGDAWLRTVAQVSGTRGVW